MVRNRSVPFLSEQGNGKHVNGTIAFPSEREIGTQSFRANSLFVRSRNWNEDGTERLRSRVT